MGCYVYPLNEVSAGAKAERVDLAANLLPPSPSTEFYACTHFSQRSLCGGERSHSTDDSSCVRLRAAEFLLLRLQIIVRSPVGAILSS